MFYKMYLVLFLLFLGLWSCSASTLEEVAKAQQKAQAAGEGVGTFVKEVWNDDRSVIRQVAEYLFWGPEIDTSNLPEVQRGLGEDRPGYRSEVTSTSQYVYYRIMDKMMRGEELDAGENLLVGFLIATRRWPDAPDVTEKDKAIQKWIDEHPDYQDAIANRLVGEAQAIGGKFGEDLDIPPNLEKFRQLYHKTPLKERSTLMNAMMNWYRAQGFDLRSDEAKAESAKKAALRKQKNEMAALDAQIGSAATKLGVHESDLLKFYNCVCVSCGGSLGGYYAPGGKYGCMAKGPLNVWEAPMPLSKKTLLGCRNLIDLEHYVNDQKIFEEMRRNDELVYQKLHGIVAAENARLAADWLKELWEMIESDETLLEAARHFIKDREIFLPGDRASLAQALNERLSAFVGSSIETGELHNAQTVQSLIDAIGDDKTQRVLQQIEQWIDSWADAKKSWFVKIDQHLEKNQFPSAENLFKMVNKAMGTNYPPAFKDPDYLKLAEAFQSKYEEYMGIVSKTLNECQQLVSDKDPRSAVAKAQSVLNEWELSKEYSERIASEMNRHYQPLVDNAKAADRSGDQAAQSGDNDQALSYYAQSLNIQKDPVVQQKFDALNAVKTKCDAWKNESWSLMAERNYKAALKVYEKLAKECNDSYAKERIAFLQAKIKRQSEADALAASQEERARSEADDREMNEGASNFAERFASRDSERSQSVSQQQSNDSYISEDERESSYEKMQAGLKESIDIHKEWIKKEDRHASKTLDRPMETVGYETDTVGADRPTQGVTSTKPESVGADTHAQSAASASNASVAGGTPSGSSAKEKLTGMFSGLKKSSASSSSATARSSKAHVASSAQSRSSAPAASSGKSWAGIWKGTYKDDRNKGCADPEGKVSLILDEHSFSGDGVGTIKREGEIGVLYGKLNNGYIIDGSRINYYDTIQGWPSGKKNCSPYLELRKQKY